MRDAKATGKCRAVNKMDKVLGLDLLKKERLSIPEEIKKLVDRREKVRKSKKWVESDKIRDKLKSKGWAVDDTPTGSRIRKI